MTSSSRHFTCDCACAPSQLEEDGGSIRISPPKDDSHRPSNETRSSNSSPVSPVSSSGPICRICHDGDAKEDLASPCRCSGTMQKVHRTCLEKWLSSSNSDACEICKYKFTIYRQPKSFSEWIQQQSHPDDYRNLMGDLLCFIVLTPLATISSYLCFIGAKYYSTWSSRYEASGLVCLSVLLLSIYVAWCIVTVRYHHRVWSIWRIENQNVHLIQMRHISSPDIEFIGRPPLDDPSITPESGSRHPSWIALPSDDLEMTTAVISQSRPDIGLRRTTTYSHAHHRINESQSLPFLVQHLTDERITRV